MMTRSLSFTMLLQLLLLLLLSIFASYSNAHPFSTKQQKASSEATAVSLTSPWDSSSSTITANPIQENDDETILDEDEWTKAATTNSVPSWRHLYLDPPMTLPRTTTTTTTLNEYFVSNNNKNLSSSFQFKGFGVSLYKSLSNFKGGAGIGLKVPLLGNWKWWDQRQQYLPSTTLTIGMYLFPFRLAIGVSTSMDVRGLKSGISSVGSTLIRIIYQAFSMLLSIVFYPLINSSSSSSTAAAAKREASTMMKKDTTAFITRTTNKMLPSQDDAPAAAAAAIVQELVGCSMWYRWSPTKGFHTRVNYWYAYLPSLHRILGGLATSSNNKTPNKILPEWLNANQASIGTDACITPGEGLSFTGILSLSGLLHRQHHHHHLNILPNKIQLSERTASVRETQTDQIENNHPAKHTTVTAEATARRKRRTMGQELNLTSMPPRQSSLVPGEYFPGPDSAVRMVPVARGGELLAKDTDVFRS
eukprot:scaffold3170_cov128-Cylindrotheca_fusiformis.AAC.19